MALLDVAILRGSPVPSVDGRIVSASPHRDSLASPSLASADMPVAVPDGDGVTAAPTPGTNTFAPATALALATTPTPQTDDSIRDALDMGGTIANTILRARCEDVARRVIREGGHTSMAALAREIGCAPATLKRLMSSDVYRDVYNRVSDELLGTIDDRIADERLDTLVRSDTLQRRALTVLAEAMAIARGHMADVADGKVVARPQLLKVAVDAAAEVRQVVGSRTGVGANGATVNINVTRNQATIIQGAIRESGIDLSDVLDGVFVVPTPASATANGG